MRYFYLEKNSLSGLRATIQGSDANHIVNVLRLETGDIIGLYDGQGMNYEARIAGVLKGRVAIEIIKSAPSDLESNIKLIVAQACLKGKKMDGLARGLCELGIYSWIPFFSKRTTPIFKNKKDQSKKAENKKTRWEKIAREAAKQRRGGRLPDICAPVSFETVLERGKGCDLKIVFWEEEKKLLKEALGTACGEAPQTIMIIMGPEGGFGVDEIEKARAAGFISVSMGPRVLRSETASLSACAIIQYVFGDMGSLTIKK